MSFMMAILAFISQILSNEILSFTAHNILLQNTCSSNYHTITLSHYGQMTDNHRLEISILEISNPLAFLFIIIFTDH